MYESAKSSLLQGQHRLRRRKVPPFQAMYGKFRALKSLGGPLQKRGNNSEHHSDADHADGYFDWRVAARAHGEVFRDVRSACTLVQVSGFIDPTWLVEIDADCTVE